MGVGVPSTVSRSSFSSLLEFKEYRHTGLKSHAVPLSRLHVERERERERTEVEGYYQSGLKKGIITASLHSRS